MLRPCHLPSLANSRAPQKRRRDGPLHSPGHGQTGTAPGAAAVAAEVLAEQASQEVVILRGPKVKKRRLGQGGARETERLERGGGSARAEAGGRQAQAVAGRSLL